MTQVLNVTVTAPATGATGSGSITINVPTAPPPGWWTTPPSQAAAADFNTLSFGDDFTSNKIATSKFAASGFNWYWGLFNPNGTYQTVNPSQVASGAGASPAGGILTLTGPGHDNDALLTIPGWALNNSSAKLPTSGCWQH